MVSGKKGGREGGKEGGREGEREGGRGRKERKKERKEGGREGGREEEEETPTLRMVFLLCWLNWYFCWQSGCMRRWYRVSHTCPSVLVSFSLFPGETSAQ